MTRDFRHFLLAVLALAIISSCASVRNIRMEFPQTETPDYGKLEYWAAHPAKEDHADLIPTADKDLFQAYQEVDVFFIHPTTYTGKKYQNRMNASLMDQKLNKQTDKTTIQYQASLFNKVGNVYAPRYRQAHISTFFSGDRQMATEVFDHAYEDVRNAFDYYMRFENKSRPFIIASHSQGTVHAVRLIKDRIDGQEIQSRLIVAYLVGMPVKKNAFDHIPPCQNPDEPGCFNSWRSFRKDYEPNLILSRDSIAVQNPISWRTDEEYIPKEQSKGAVLRNFNKVFHQIIDAQIHEGILWVTKPKFPWSFLFTTKNYHVADMNFFYKDIQYNARERIENYLRRNGDPP